MGTKAGVVKQHRPVAHPKLDQNRGVSTREQERCIQNKTTRQN